MSQGARWAVIAGVAAVVGWLLLGPFAGQLELTAEAERDLLRVQALLRLGEWPTHGPQVSPLTMHLPPGWYLLAAPVIAVWPSPYAIHVLHTGVFLAGLVAFFFALRRRSGDWSALTVCIALGTSHFAADILSRVWHPGMMPGLALLWVALLERASDGATPTARARALAGMWAVLIVMIQCHFSALAFVLPTAGLQVHRWWRDRLTGGRAINALGGALALGLALFFLRMLLDLDVGQATGLREGHPLARLLAVIRVTPGLLVSAFSHPPVDGLAVAVLLAAAGGLASACIPGGALFPRMAALAAVLALPLVAEMAGLFPSPRYFTPLLPPIYALAAVGLGAALRHPRAHRALGPLAAALMAFIALVGNPLHRPEPQAPRDRGSLSLMEQETLLGMLRHELQLSFSDLDRRVHGPLFGYGSAFRYLALIDGYMGARPSTRLGDDEHLTVAIAGTPEPAGAREVARITFDGRAVRVLAHRQRFDYRAVTASVRGAACAFGLPYHPPAPLREAELFGIRPPANPERCAGAGDVPLVLHLRDVQGESPLHLVVSYRTSDIRVADAPVSITAATPAGAAVPVTPVAGTAAGSTYVFRLTAAPDVDVSVSPVLGLESLDLY